MTAWITCRDQGSSGQNGDNRSRKDFWSRLRLCVRCCRRACRPGDQLHRQRPTLRFPKLRNALLGKRSFFGSRLERTLTGLRSQNSSITGRSADYELEPDRIVFYLWSGLRRREVQLPIQRRVSPSAPKAAPPNCFDYYNPRSDAVLAAQTFQWRSQFCTDPGGFRSCQVSRLFLLRRSLRIESVNHGPSSILRSLAIPA